MDERGRDGTVDVSGSDCYEPSIVTVELVDAGEGTCDLVLTHERLGRRETRSQYRGGWDQILTRLVAHIHPY